MNLFLKQIADGNRRNAHGKAYAPSTKIAIRQICARIRDFQKDKNTNYQLTQVDIDFYSAFMQWLNSRDYALNTVGKYVCGLKCLLAAAKADGYPIGDVLLDRRFVSPHTEVDSVFLTREELDRMMAVPAGRLSQARDVFMVGVLTAQRVSDYRRILPSNIHTVSVLQDGPEPHSRQVTYINITQRKTGTKVSIPCSSELCAILDRYNGKMPRISALRLNRDIKELGRLAGITQDVEVCTIRGGVEYREIVPKYRLICSHTARRTGATLMYLAGLDIYDIMKITGHRSPDILRRYIRADTLDVAVKLALRYNYFD